MALLFLIVIGVIAIIIVKVGSCVLYLVCLVNHIFHRASTNHFLILSACKPKQQGYPGHPWAGSSCSYSETSLGDPLNNRWINSSRLDNFSCSDRASIYTEIMNYKLRVCRRFSPVSNVAILCSLGWIFLQCSQGWNTIGFIRFFSECKLYTDSLCNCGFLVQHRAILLLIP